MNVNKKDPKQSRILCRQAGVGHVKLNCKINAHLAPNITGKSNKDLMITVGEVVDDKPALKKYNLRLKDTEAANNLLKALNSCIDKMK